MKIKPAQKLKGRVIVPGDKSISHRAAIISALAPGNSTLENFSTSEDCQSTVRCLQELGVSIERCGNTLTVAGLSKLRAPERVMDCGNSGSTIRMLAGVLAGHDFIATMTGDESLRSRPMMRVIDPLERMGARVEAKDGKPPLRIRGQLSLGPIEYEMPVASAQVKSSLLFAGMNATGVTKVIEQHTTRDHTERLLNWFGVTVTTSAIGKNVAQISITGPAAPKARDVRIPGDISSAAFFIAAAALMPGSDLEVRDIGLNPTRTQFLQTLPSLGLKLEISGREDGPEPMGNVRVLGLPSAPASKPELFNVLPTELIPQLIDELPLLAVVGARVAGGIAIRGSEELRFKESDRIAATVKNLRAMGAEVEEFSDGLAVPGPQLLRGAALDSFGDHRIAMAFSIAALMADGESFISGAEAVAVSFPEFFHLLEAIVQR